MATKYEQNWGIATHLSVFAGYLIPMAGLIAPIVIWMFKREDSAYLDEQGKKVLNMIMTAVLVAIPVTFLCFVLVGIPLAIMLALYCLATPIMAAVKCAHGENFEYPFTLKIIK